MLVVTLDLATLNDLVAGVLATKDSSRLNRNPLVTILASGNQNLVSPTLAGQIQALNAMSTINLQTAITGGVPPVTISVSGLNDERSSSSPSTSRISISIESNNLAQVRDYLITFISNLAISNIDSITLESSLLAQLTEITSELTRETIIVASTRCYQLAVTLQNLAGSSPYESLQSAVESIDQCASQTLTTINVALQGRGIVLDFNRANTFPADYDTDLESPWSNLNLFAEGDDLSWATIEKNRNRYYQQQSATIVQSQADEIFSMTSETLLLHLNVGQRHIVNTSSVIALLEKLDLNTLTNKSIRWNEQTEVKFPSMAQTNSSTISYRGILLPLASLSNPSVLTTNLSRSLLLTVFNDESQEIALPTSSVELCIPRDPNLTLPPLTVQNISSLNARNINNRLFNLHQTSLKINASIHLEISPLDFNGSYLLIYRFDAIPPLNSSLNQTDGWTLFCPEGMNTDVLFTFFLGNQRTSGHQSLIFGLRELNSSECQNRSSGVASISDQLFNFTSNYALRSFTSSCYYLDGNQTWRSDGLLVGPRTSHFFTQCLSSHLSTFAGGFVVLPTPINWNFVFANAGFSRNKVC